MKTQLDYYIEKQDELVKKYNGKIIALKDGEFKGVFKTRTEALHFMLENGHKSGEFMIILCSPGDNEYTVRFNSNVTFYQTAINN